MNLRQGKGASIAADGSIYKGEFWQNMKHGEGVLYRPDGSVYEGTWMGNIIIGEGKNTIVCGRGPNAGGPENVKVRVFGY